MRPMPESSRITPVPASQGPSLLWVLLLQLIFWAAACSQPGAESREGALSGSGYQQHSEPAALLVQEQARPLRQAEHTLLTPDPGKSPAWIPATFTQLLLQAALLYYFICILAPSPCFSPELRPVAPRAPPRVPRQG